MWLSGDFLSAARRMPSVLLIAPLLLHFVTPAMGSGFLSSAYASAAASVAEAKEALGEAAAATRKAARKAAEEAEEASQAVADEAETAAGQVSEAVSDASAEAALAAADLALRHSSKCDMFHQNAHKVEPFISPVIARGMQDSAADPSADASTCRKVALDVNVALMDKYWHDATGLSSQLVAGLSKPLLSYVCGSPLMTSLKNQEGIRKSDPEAYKARIQKTLKESVFTGAWVREAIKAHCGEAPAVRLFTVSSLEQSLGHTSRSTLVSAACLSAAGFSAALLGVLLASARGRRLQHSDVPAPAPLLDGSSCDGGSGSEVDADAVE